MQLNIFLTLYFISLFNFSQISKNIKHDNTLFVTTLAGLSCNGIVTEGKDEDEDEEYDIDIEEDVEDDDDDDIIRKKYTIEYFKEKEKLIESYHKDSAFYKRFHFEFLEEKKKYGQHLFL